MKILYLSACSQLGGAERALLDMLASIRAADTEHSLHVVTTEDGPLISACRALNVEATVVNVPASIARLGDASAREDRPLSLLTFFAAAPAIAAYLLRLRRVIGLIAPDVIHTNGFKMHVLGALIKPRRVSLVWHMHDFISSRPVMAKVLRHLCGSCSLAVANSDSVAADVSAVCRNRVEIRTLYNGVDLQRFSPTGAALDLDELSGMRPSVPDTIRVGLVATLARWKGHETFLRALSLLPRDVPVRAYIIGDAIYQTNGSQYCTAQLRELARELGVVDRVGFSGFVSDSAAAMRALDVIVHASTEPEPFGLVIAEAAACGKAIIASKHAGATQLMHDGTDFLSHRAGDSVSLAAQVLGLALSPHVRRKLGTAARATAERVFDRTRLASDLLPLYRSLVTKTSVEKAEPEFSELCSLASDL